MLGRHFPSGSGRTGNSLQKECCTEILRNIPRRYGTTLPDPDSPGGTLSPSPTPCLSRGDYDRGTGEGLTLPGPRIFCCNIGCLRYKEAGDECILWVEVPFQAGVVGPGANLEAAAPVAPVALPLHLLALRP